MIDTVRLHEILIDYKNNLRLDSKWWRNEEYKWEAVKWFQDNWNINAENFYEMLHTSLAKTRNLLASWNYYPRKMIECFAEVASDEVRDMFLSLFNENKDIYERFDEFKQKSADLLKRYGKENQKNHSQTENAISTYLWLRYPDKYYIYKYSVVDAVADKVNSNYRFKKGTHAEYLKNFYNLYDEINNELKKDTELVNLFKSKLTDVCYPDPGLKTLTYDLCFYIFVCAKEKAETKVECGQSELKPKSNAAFLHWFKPLLQALHDLGGAATPTEARNKIIENENLTEEETSVYRGRNNVNKFENEVAWARSYLVQSGYIDNSVIGVWKLTEAGMTVDMTDELASQIFKERVSEMRHKKSGEGDALGDADVDTVHYWLYAPGEGAAMWEDFYNRGVMGLGWHELGDLREYASKEEMNDKLRKSRGGDSSYRNSVHAVWQFVNVIKPGDIVFAKRGRSEILGRGIVESDYEYDDIDDSRYPNTRKVRWINKGSWQYNEKFAMKTLTDITDYKDFVNKINSLFEDENGEEDEVELIKYPTYTEEDFLREVYIDKGAYTALVKTLHYKMNVILQGAPGVGKTYLAKRLAYSIMGVKDVSRVMMVQFHQSYSYEDFIMGFRPSAVGFELKNGAFYEFCKRAEVDGENAYFFIIDEINRGNMSKIFGELFMLIENDKRGNKNKLQLLYSDELFYVPDNVYIIGTMNTADRSLAMLDYALRRRFAFFDLKPAFNSEGFRKYRNDLNNEKLNKLVQCVENLNERIAVDDSLGEGFCIGHSYFCNLTSEDLTDEKLSAIVEYELVPTLKEYWFDEPLKIKEWSDNLRNAIK